MNNSELWQKVLDDIKKNVTPATFNSFISRLSLRDYSEEPPLAHIEGEKQAICNIINRRYIGRLNDSFKNVTGKDFRVMVKTAEEYKELSASIYVPEPAEEVKTVRFNLNPGFMREKIFDPKMTFDNFVEGDSNRFAYATCFAVAQSPSNIYNPLFIYGNSGLGKTHLMHATGIYLLQHFDKKILYVTSETFANDYTSAINAMSEKKMMEFKNKYRKPDVLFIDDVQFFEGKEGMQDEFFHTFNSLYENNHQIILSGDRPPNKLVHMQERLRSRFAWNMIVEIKAPDYETRVNILMKKAENLNVEMNDDIYDIICFIANRIKDNVRLLESAFFRVISFAKIVNVEPDLSFAKSTLTDLMQGGENITPDKIKTAVCKHYKIKISELDSDTRKNSIAYPRQIAMYLCRTMTDYSLPRIGMIFGNKHYSTVKYACDKIEEDIKINSELRDTIEQLKEKINS